MFKSNIYLLLSTVYNSCGKIGEYSTSSNRRSAVNTLCSIDKSMDMSSCASTNMLFEYKMMSDQLYTVLAWTKWIALKAHSFLSPQSNR